LPTEARATTGAAGGRHAGRCAVREGNHDRPATTTTAAVSAAAPTCPLATTTATATATFCRSVAADTTLAAGATDSSSLTRRTWSAVRRQQTAAQEAKGPNKQSTTACATLAARATLSTAPARLPVGSSRGAGRPRRTTAAAKCEPGSSAAPTWRGRCVCTWGLCSETATSAIAGLATVGPATKAPSRARRVDNETITAWLCRDGGCVTRFAGDGREASCASQAPFSSESTFTPRIPREATLGHRDRTGDRDVPGRKEREDTSLGSVPGGDVERASDIDGRKAWGRNDLRAR
jgi:hypothetical protein